MTSLTQESCLIGRRRVGLLRGAGELMDAEKTGRRGFSSTPTGLWASGSEGQKSRRLMGEDFKVSVYFWGRRDILLCCWCRQHWWLSHHKWTEFTESAKPWDISLSLESSRLLTKQPKWLHEVAAAAASRAQFNWGELKRSSPHRQ